ncbi:nuclear transport factor 2 family protein [Sphingomonas bacterium]|uniref:nuclear transport factor 2 family protein n=1 Tax=Sphingomonas bacterium TaxID=1895847 RepID=UPI00157725E4|nr:nuclear transport factor 2 family protein [Sphingomonas bacterium]
MLLFLLAALSGQVTPVQPLPKGTGQPPAIAADEPAVLAAVQRMFDGLAARDPARILAQTLPEGGATVASEGADGARTLRHLSWAAFAAGLHPGPERYAERLLDPAIEIDGDIAMVWSPYVFTVDGKLQHCGTDHFDLVREAGAWKVLNVTWTQRTTGCDAQ